MFRYYSSTLSPKNTSNLDNYMLFAENDLCFKTRIKIARFYTAEAIKPMKLLQLFVICWFVSLIN